MSDSLVALVLAGALAGIVHVLSGPDHLVAVAPFALRAPRGAWLSGLRWGVGHAAGVVIVAVVAWLFRFALPLERLSGWSEQLVGVALIAIGLLTIRAAIRHRIHVHEHQHDGIRHAHFHVHSTSKPDDALGLGAHHHSHAAFGMGALHGVAGGSHFVVVLPALAFPTSAGAAVYVAAYSVGSVVAMVLFAMLVGRITRRLATDGGPVYRNLLTGAGALAVVVGVVWLGN